VTITEEEGEGGHLKMRGTPLGPEKGFKCAFLGGGPSGKKGTGRKEGGLCGTRNTISDKQSTRGI